VTAVRCATRRLEDCVIDSSMRAWRESSDSSVISAQQYGDYLFAIPWTRVRCIWRSGSIFAAAIFNGPSGPSFE